ncbi:MAG: hypothetical protein Q9227_004856 [Pyrenula ochraceoflavens]
MPSSFYPSPEPEDPSLQLPRILCLHGGGTNATIFRMQCRVLERALSQSFRFLYAEAPFPAQPGPDVTSVYQKHGPFKAWLRIRPEDPEHDAFDITDQIDESINMAIAEDDMRGATGEVVGLLGFSQGAKVAASILYAQQTLRSQRATPVWPDFRFAVLLAGRGPLVWLLPEQKMPMGLVDATHLSTLTEDPPLKEGSDQHILRVPTIHVHGLKDPGLPLHRKLLSRYCDPNSVRLIEWEGEHRVPIKSKDVNTVVRQICSTAKRTGVLSR